MFPPPVFCAGSLMRRKAMMADSGAACGSRQQVRKNKGLRHCRRPLPAWGRAGTKIPAHWWEKKKERKRNIRFAARLSAADRENTAKFYRPLPEGALG